VEFNEMLRGITEFFRIKLWSLSMSNALRQTARTCYRWLLFKYQFTLNNSWPWTTPTEKMIGWIIMHWPPRVAYSWLCFQAKGHLWVTYTHLRSGVVVSALASINEVNLCRTRLVLRWATVSGFNSRCRTFISVCNQPATQGQLSLQSLWGW